MQTIFNLNDKIISIDISSMETYINIVFIINNKIYDILDNNCYRRIIKSNNIYNNYCNLDIFFNIKYSSGLELKKKKVSKYREFMKIPSKYYNTLYAFFIYTKYYIIYDDIKYYNKLYTIYTYKIFNCRDLYRIISFI